MGLLDHKALAIIMGIAAAPGDPNLVESPLVVVNLMDNTSGIALAGVDGWSPKIPSIESSGIWSDSPLSPGRQLLSAVEGNVTETMKLVITGSSMSAVIKTLDSLYIMANNARAFWTDNSQIQPVFLKWWASCGGGPQYALIYNMTIDPTWGDSPAPSLTATLVIERETYWRGIPPGANPQQWTFEWFNQPYSVSKLILSGSTPMLLNGSSPNRSEIANPSGSIYNLVSDNCITIPAASIPGDAPALMYLAPSMPTTSYQIMLGKKTTKILQYSTVPNTFPQNTVFNAANAALGFGTLGVNATAAADTGASLDMASNAKRIEVSFATATNQLRLTINLQVNRFIGRWMVFMRCRQSAVTAGDITMYLRYGQTIAGDTDGVKLNVANPQVIAGAGNTTNWGLVYMGVLSIPTLPQKATTNVGAATGSGLNGLLNTTLQLGLFASRTAGASLLYVNDFLFIPVDEGSITMELADSVSTFGAIYDETGYLSHGLPDPFASFGAGTSSQSAKFTGTGIQLTPNTENRLYFIQYDTSLQSSISQSTNWTLDIVPRWRGIRDIADIRG